VHGNAALVIAYAVIWLALLGYLGWIALRLRGVRDELATVRALVDEREQRPRAEQDH
jgi:CcmD family protein